MENLNMTDHQHNNFIQLIISILRKCSSVDEAIAELEKLLK